MGKFMLYNMLGFILSASQCTIQTWAATTMATTTIAPVNGTTAEIAENLSSTEKPMTSPTTTNPEVSTLGLGQHSQDILEEFEASLTEKQQDKYLMHRSEASGNRTLHITANNSDRKYKATLCVKGSGDNKVQLQVIGVMYSNDGPSDTISLQLDETSLGSAKTDEVYNGGHEWNVFKNTGPIGEATTLDNGNHTLTLTVKTDKWGAEIDSIKLRVHNQDSEAKIVCKSELA